jgi:hypothetical protein
MLQASCRLFIKWLTRISLTVLWTFCLMLQPVYNATKRNFFFQFFGTEPIIHARSLDWVTAKWRTSSMKADEAHFFFAFFPVSLALHKNGKTLTSFEHRCRRTRRLKWLELSTNTDNMVHSDKILHMQTFIFETNIEKSKPPEKSRVIFTWWY